MGDFKVKVGGEKEMEGCVGPYTVEDSNKSGYKLGKTCMGLNLKIANTFFDHPKEEKWRWKFPDGRTTNEIDHILTDDIRLIYEN